MFRGRRAAAVLAAVLTLGVVACGDDDESDGSASAGGGSTAESTTTGADVGDTKASSGVSDFQQYVGGKAGKADPNASPIVIGWVNQQGGPADVGPGATKGAELAVKYVNEELGGIGGHPLKLKTCFTSTTEEQGQACGQKMANDKEISVVDVGAVAIGAQSLVATLGGEKPMVHGIALGGADSTNKNGFALFGDATRVSAPFGTFAAKVLHAKTAAAVWPEIPGINEGAQATVKGAEGNGIEVKQVAWNPNATDLVGPLTAAGAQTADAIIATSDPKGCVNLAKALDDLKIETPVASQPLCLNPTVSKALGDIPPWYYGIASSLATDATDPSSVEFMKVAGRYGNAQEAGADVWIPVGFSQTMTIAQWMNKIGADKITPEAIAEQGKAFKGPLLMGAPTLNCGKYPEAPAICNDQTKFYKYEGKGKFVPASGWVQPPQ